MGGKTQLDTVTVTATNSTVSWELEESCLESPLEPAEEGGSAELGISDLDSSTVTINIPCFSLAGCGAWFQRSRMLDTGCPGADTEGAGSLSSVVECLWKAEVSDLAKRQESCMDFSI